MRRRYPDPKKVRLPKQLDIRNASPFTKKVVRFIAATPLYLELRKELAPYVKKKLISKELADAVLTKFIDGLIKTMPADLATAKKFLDKLEKDSAGNTQKFFVKGVVGITDTRSNTRIMIVNNKGKLRIVVEQGDKK